MREVCRRRWVALRPHDVPFCLRRKKQTRHLLAFEISLFGNGSTWVNGRELLGRYPQAVCDWQSEHASHGVFSSATASCSCLLKANCHIAGEFLVAAVDQGLIWGNYPQAFDITKPL